MDPNVLHLDVDKGLDMPFPDPSSSKQAPEAAFTMGCGVPTTQQCSVERHVDHAMSANTCRLG